jgi:hypothetical protein
MLHGSGERHNAVVKAEYEEVREAARIARRGRRGGRGCCSFLGKAFGNA